MGKVICKLESSGKAFTIGPALRTKLRLGQPLDAVGLFESWWSC